MLYTFLLEVKVRDHGDNWWTNFQVTASSAREAVRLFKESHADDFGPDGCWEVREVSLLLPKSEWE
jgi:hypothetical protein